jgi:hypothetical protein
MRNFDNGAQVFVTDGMKDKARFLESVGGQADDGSGSHNDSVRSGLREIA